MKDLWETLRVKEPHMSNPVSAAERLARGRRKFLQLGAALSGLLVGCRPSSSVPQPGPSFLGGPVSEYGLRSQFEKTVRLFRNSLSQENNGSQTPLQDLEGIITPAGLHFERHHAGIPVIDPTEHRLLLHGMVERPLILTVEELKRFPSHSQINFVECSGNGRIHWGDASDRTAQQIHGLTSCSEWTGVKLSVLLNEIGVQSGASWILVEGADACKMTRSLPLAKAYDDAVVAYAQNGEALRPAQGYPLRLLVPGWEGNINVKWLRRLKIVDQPYMTKDETSKYTDLLATGEARQFSFMMDAKSLITRPSGRQHLPGPGFCEITGLAWSGRGTITKVEISTDGGHSWQDARLQDPVLPLAHTRFRFDWNWDGREAVLQSRCTDETGYVQPTRNQLIAARGTKSSYHYNGIQSWKVLSDGTVRNVHV